MSALRRGPALLLLALAGCEPPPPSAEKAGVEEAAPELPPPPVRDPALEAELRRLAATLDGSVGAYVLHLEGNVAASLNGRRTFPLASVGKLPVAYAALLAPGAGAGDTVALVAGDRAPGTTPLAPEAEGRVAIATLVERSLAHSDNTASDALLRVAGGTAPVRGVLDALGVEGVRVDRSMRALVTEWGSAREAFLDDPRDTGSAEAVVALLAAVHGGEGLPEESAELLRRALGATVTGPARIRAGLPAGTPVAHKTGTLGPFTHDVGIVTLPEGRGHLAVAFLVRSDAPPEARERLVAALARAAWARFAGEGGA